MLPPKLLDTLDIYTSRYVQALFYHWGSIICFACLWKCEFTTHDSWWMRFPSVINRTRLTLIDDGMRAERDCLIILKTVDLCNDLRVYLTLIECVSIIYEGSRLYKKAGLIKEGKKGINMEPAWPFMQLLPPRLTDPLIRRFSRQIGDPDVFMDPARKVVVLFTYILFKLHRPK